MKVGQPKSADNNDLRIPSSAFDPCIINRETLEQIQWEKGTEVICMHTRVELLFLTVWWHYSTHLNVSVRSELRNVITVMTEFRPRVPAYRGEMIKNSLNRHTHTRIKYLVPLALGHTPKIHFVQTCLYQKGFWKKCTGVVYRSLNRFYEICHIVPAHGRKGAYSPLFHVER